MEQQTATSVLGAHATTKTATTATAAAIAVLVTIVVTALHAQLRRPDDVAWRDLVPGALLVGIIVAAMQALVLGYIGRKLSSSNELYGGIGTAIALLIWLYLLGRVLVLGPLLDVVLRRRQGATH